MSTKSALVTVTTLALPAAHKIVEAAGVLIKRPNQSRCLRIRFDEIREKPIKMLNVSRTWVLAAPARSHARATVIELLTVVKSVYG